MLFEKNMKNSHQPIIRCLSVTLVFCAALFLRAEEKLSEPVYRVAKETATVQSTSATQTPTTADASPAAAAAPAAANSGKAVFDLTQKPGEHPLLPVVRTLKVTQEEIDRNVHDYCCTLVKHERVDGELGEPQHIMLKVMNDPFSVYMSFLKPYAGREVLYVTVKTRARWLCWMLASNACLGK